MHTVPYHCTRVQVNLADLTHNLRVLQAQAGDAPLWPAIKANAYGHGADLIARHLRSLGHDTLCVAQVGEAVELITHGIEATYLVLSGAVPDNAADCVAHGLEPVVACIDMVAALDAAAAAAGRRLAVHLKVDTGMGRFGIAPESVSAFLDGCESFRSVWVRGIMSHFACADAADKRSAERQLARFEGVRATTAARGRYLYHMANSAALLDLPKARFDAARPGIAIYGLKPSATMSNPAVDTLRPVLRLVSRITFLKEVAAGVGISYGHVYRTTKQTLVATLPIGYGDGLQRGLSGRLCVLINGQRCPQIGRITMDQLMVDVSALRGEVRPGDEAVLIGSQRDAETVSADEIAQLAGTINYEVVTALAQRIPRFAVDTNRPG